MSRAIEIRKTVLEMLFRAGASHLGPSMSTIEILDAIYRHTDCAAIRQREPGRDRVILSKGHAAAALYGTLWHYGLLGDLDPRSDYCREGSILAGHASHMVPGVEHSTGALGHGLPVAVGCALGLRARGFDAARVFCVVGDGELQEGSNWEALTLARTAKLGNLIVLVDANGISSIRRTSDVIDLEPMASTFSGMGLEVREISGHDSLALDTLFAQPTFPNRPTIAICRTVKGYGVPFAENEPIWHYRSLDEERFRSALQSLEEAVAAKLEVVV